MESDIGNIRALREWTRRYFYTKEDINFFMTKLNQGLKGYALMFIGPRNKKVTVNPGNYEFTLNSDGWYRYLFFFNRNQEITISVQDGETITYQLDEYNDTINLSPWVIATPQMTNNFTPSGYAFGHISGQYSYRGFDRSTSTNANMSSNQTSSYVGYEFPEPTIIYKFKLLFVCAWSTREPQNSHMIIQGSNDKSHWTDLYDKDLNDFVQSTVYTVEGEINNPQNYLYYRVWNNPLTVYGEIHVIELYLYTIDQFTTVYRIATPVMTSNTDGGNLVSASSAWQPAWQAFNQSTSNYGWMANQTLGTAPQWIQFKFADGSPKLIKKIRVWEGSYMNDNYIISFKLLASNDGTNFTELGTYTLRHGEYGYNQSYYVDNITYYLYYRIQIVSANYDHSHLGFLNIDLYEEV